MTRTPAKQRLWDYVCDIRGMGDNGELDEMMDAIESEVSEGRDRLEAALRDVLDSLDRAYGKRLGPGATTFRPRARAALGDG